MLFRSLWSLYLPGVMSVSEPTEYSIRIYPNPFKDFVSIELPESLKDQFTNVTVHDAIGRMVFNTKISTLNYQLQLGELNPGIYYIHLMNRNFSKVFKMVKY